MSQEILAPDRTGDSHEHLPKRSVIVELRSTPALLSATRVGGNLLRLSHSRAIPFDHARLLPGIEIDSTFPLCTVPAVGGTLLSEDQQVPTNREVTFESLMRDYNVIVSAELTDEEARQLRERPEVFGVYSDPVIEPFSPDCYSSPAFGTDLDVERLLCVPKLRSAGLDGTNVLVAIVDTGINMEYLNARGKRPKFDRLRSWVPSVSPPVPDVPGQMEVGHGTMCAFDVCIAAPNCTLLDIALLSPPFELSPTWRDFNNLVRAMHAYEHLLLVMKAPPRPGESRSLVVTNAWGVYLPESDFPIGDESNYSDNPSHPFNRCVTALELAGADILFPAGNCGPKCPYLFCRGVTTNTIQGANSHPSVLSVAGVDTARTRVGYSSVGPGRLAQYKPDICGYTHFAGSGVYPADGGTSAASAVVAGLVAAFRTKAPYDPTSPQTHPVSIRGFITSSAHDLGVTGYDFEHGYGVVDGCELVKRHFLINDPPIGLGPSLADLLKSFCRRYPHLCREPASKIPRVAVTVPGMPAELHTLLAQISQETGEVDDNREFTGAQSELVAYLAGFVEGQRQTAASTSIPKDCGCKH